VKIEAAILAQSLDFRLCADCGIPFAARFPWHRRCSTCHRWSIAARHIGIARAALTVVSS